MNKMLIATMKEIRIGTRAGEITSSDLFRRRP